MTLTDVPGVAVGHWTDDAALTGVTVMTFPEPNVAAVDVRGGAPGTRETALLAPGMKVETIQGLVFAGGSAFGLAAADGVVRALAADGRGHPTAVTPVPIVPAAILYDLLIGDPQVRPGPSEGEQAYRSASTEPVEMGNVGAGTGALVAGWRGQSAMRKGGLGSATATADVGVVGALVVVNAVGDIFTLEGESLTGGPPIPGPPQGAPRPMQATTLVAVATDLAFSRTDLQRLAVRAHDAIGACVRPAHTRYDGDVVFAVSCGSAAGSIDAAMEATFHAVGAAIEAAVRHATSVPGAPAIEDRAGEPEQVTLPLNGDAAAPPVTGGDASPEDGSGPERLARLAAEAAGCTQCRLSEARTQVVFGIGDPEADLMFVGEAPGQREDELGEPFVGRSGQLLDQLLGEIGLRRADVYIANVVKCRPPGNRDPRQDEIDACKGYLREQLRLIDPKVVVTLGNFASKLLLNTTTGITRLRGQAYPWWNRRLVPTYHPAAALRGSARVLEEMRSDFLVASQLLESDPQ